MSDTNDDCAAHRTEAMDRLAASLKTVMDCAVQVDDALHDVSSRASQLDSTSDDVLSVIDDSSRISALLDALCARQPRYACFLWTAARNLVRDVIGHVTSIDLQPPIKDAEDVTELDDVGGRHRRRAAVEMELFHGNDTHLAYADWLEAVSTSHHPSPNHDLCCRLLSHIPLLAAYTGWPSEHHGSSESEAGTQNTKDSNGGTGVTERANEGVVDTDLRSEDQPTTWRPSEEDKKYIEETVRSLVDREDLCRLLMIAMATELERLTSGEDGDQSDAKSPTRIIQFAAESSPEDFDHGDTAHEASYKCERSNSQEICKIKSTNTAALGHLGEELAENAGCCSETAGNGESVRTGVIVFEDAASDSLESARSNAPPSINIASVSAENPLPDVTDTGDLTAQDLHWFDRQCRKTVAPLSKSLDVELLEAIRAAETPIDIRQANSPLCPHQKAVNSTAHGLHHTVDSENGSSPVKPQTLAKTTQEVDRTQAPVDKSKSSLERLLIQNLESLSVGSKHVSAATQKPANTLVELPVQQPQSETEVPLLLTSCTAVSDGENTDGIRTNGDVAVTQPRQLCTVRGEKEEKRDDRYDHPVSLEGCGLGPAKLTEAAKDRRSERRSVKLHDDCRVTFRPLPVPVTSQEAVNHVLDSSALRPHNATYARMSRLPQPTGRYRKPRSNPHDVKCAQRRKSVAV